MIEELRSQAGPGMVTKRYNSEVIARFRASRDTDNAEMKDLLLLTTTGVLSGLLRTTPLVFVTDGQQVYIVASKAGANTHPAWFHNLVAHPSVTVERNSETYKAIATILDEPERSRIYGLAAQARSDIAEYQERTQRVIPVVELRRS
jgi:deazaflavin-dependent oxidoreductase (nitroreductase family)